MVVASSLSMSLVSTAAAASSASIAKRVPVSSLTSSAGNEPSVSFSSEPSFHGEAITEFGNCLRFLQGKLKRRQLVLGLGGALTTSTLIPLNSASGEEMMKKYQSYVDLEDGYSYIYPSDWRVSPNASNLPLSVVALDIHCVLMVVRARFMPTKKKDIHELGPKEQVISDLISHVYAAPTQKPNIYSMQEKSVDGKNYYTFEYELTSPNYSSVSLATIAIGNGRYYYTLIVGANERRWKRVRNQLKVVADSFKLLDI
ncbi:unnamed protein product [Linum tenue]|uniref:PsbP C-terminal domain-containing protein n=1 Tax=Linum tenue TaxID=586396 RepID=A0AAV0JND6_9ROSI|nr:unnamed protein product [Linum tenue]